MDWFEQLTGFKEASYHDTRRKLVFQGNTLFSTENQRRFDLGQFELAQLLHLRHRVKLEKIPKSPKGDRRPVSVREINGDVYRLHSQPESSGALFQVASQFNLLEMSSPLISPEDGVTRYQYDLTQGPACAMAAGPATLFRNYGVRVGHHHGQTTDRQINALDELAQELSIQNFWMQNGYAMIGERGLKDLARTLSDMSTARRDELKGLLKVGIHWNTEVTVPGTLAGQKASQVFCSALPIAYNTVQNPELWEPLARLVLEACYEATLLVGILNAKLTGNPRIFLTRVGGGVFGNPKEWIDHAIEVAIDKVSGWPLEVIHVTR